MMKRIVRYGPELRVLIVGGGVSGLALAALLEQRGFSPLVVEQSSGEGGADHVIGLWPAGSRILKGIGRYPHLMEVGVECARYVVANERGEILHKYSLAPVAEQYGPVINVCRRDLMAVLRTAVSEERVHFRTTIRDIIQSATGAAATFSDGTTAEFDVIVGCDGVRSSVREIAFGAALLTYSGFSGWSFSIPCPFVPPPEVVEYWGADKFLATYPLRDRLAARVVARGPAGGNDPLASRLERFADVFAAFRQSVPWLFGEFSGATHVAHHDFNDIRMERWHSGRVVLIGDAAHGNPPMNAMGAALALESAAVLAEELCRTDSEYVSAALQRFEHRRRPRVDHIHAQSRRLARVMFAAGGRLAWLRNSGVRLSTDAVLLDEVDGILAGQI